MAADLKGAFDDAMMDLYRRMRKECGRSASRFFAMLNESGGLMTAHSLLYAQDVSDGFRALWELGRLDLTVEAEILLPQWKVLFSEEDRARARKRLEDYQYKFPTER